ncbi:hypothetical protein N7492_007715 [Penicillium capsulatum]|uniref:Vacuolar ATPase assembly protein VMA22 n=1 Tax=Penicillium capsulatum TaxID=69766 RepID=A0A9W9I0A3_9EURO|nr:hypothetical protein N7492_007715 [Penicillium capsulatum]KAJ6117547.1 hypothetical protein N7512_007272 [Penicillium capsulatum]
MSQVPTPPASRPGSEAPEVVAKPNAGASSELRESLDTLLEQYLHLLDRQQQLQSGISKQLSSGFLALAHANYTCPPGRRYGADYYDERMKATRKISIKPKSEPFKDDQTIRSEDEGKSCPPEDFEYKLYLRCVSNHEPEEQNHTAEEPKSTSTEPPSNTSKSDKIPTSSSEPSDLTQEPNTDSSQTSKDGRKKFRSEDPIHWYGILVPPSLRTAQQSFTGAIQGPIPELAVTVSEMRALELRIAQLRNKLEEQATAAGS